MQRVHWRLQQRRRIIFTDERRFRIFRADGRKRVWHVPREELRLADEMAHSRLRRLEQFGVELTPAIGSAMGLLPTRPGRADVRPDRSNQAAK